MKLVKECLGLGISIEKNSEKQINILNDQRFVFTGSLEKMSRKEAQEKVVQLGGRSSSSISKKTNYLVAGLGSGTKVKKAKELNVTIINENEFLKMINSN